MDRVEHKPEGPPKLPEGLRGLGMGLGAGGSPLQDVSRELSTVKVNLHILFGVCNQYSHTSVKWSNFILL
jgi:hypothetical protein